MQIYPDSELSNILIQGNDIAFLDATLSQKLIFLSICYAALFLSFGLLKEIIESLYISIFLIIGKIINIDIKFLNLSVI